jgi:hypothetical protein
MDIRRRMTLMAVYFPMQKEEKRIIVNIHEAF